MARKVKVKQILELNYLGVSNNKISDTRNISKHSIHTVLVMAQEKGITFPNIQDKTDQEVYKLFFPDNYSMEDFYESVDFKEVHKELKIKGVTLKILWNEYKDRCSINRSFAMSYAKFCRDYNKYIAHNNLTNHLIHKPGDSIEVDWAGKVMHFNSLGIPKKVYMFVGSLPFSQYTYIEPCLDMKEKSWIECHIHMWKYFGGVTPRTICDNLKTGVIKHPREGEIILNDNYESLAKHYVTAILPAGVRKPKQKSSAEGNVGNITTAIIAKLRNEKYDSFMELSTAVSMQLEIFNSTPFQKRELNRKDIFMRDEKNKLAKLPLYPFEIAEWTYRRKVNNASHVTYNKNFYSCPTRYIGQYVDLKATSKLLEVFFQGKRIKSHKLFLRYEENLYSTDSKDFPDYFSNGPDDYESYRTKAASIGPSTLIVIERIFQKVEIESQGYNFSKAILGLHKKYTKERLEKACECALTITEAPRYRILKSILANKRDLEFAETNKPNDKKEVIGYIRGKQFYEGETENDK